MVITNKQVLNLQNGKLNKTDFLKILNNGLHEIANYLIRFENPIIDYKATETIRERMYIKYGYKFTILMELGEIVSFNYKVCTNDVYVVVKGVFAGNLFECEYNVGNELIDFNNIGVSYKKENCLLKNK